jgi:hypothetical protein
VVEVCVVVIANVLGLHEQRRPWSSGKRHHHSMKKNLARLAREQSSCNLRTDLESDVHACIHMSSIHEWTHTSHA